MWILNTYNKVNTIGIIHELWKPFRYEYGIVFIISTIWRLVQNTSLVSYIQIIHFIYLFYVDINTSHTMATILCQRALHFIIGLFTNSIRLGTHQKSILVEANVLSQFVWTILHTCTFGVWYYFCQSVESPELFWRSNTCDNEINVAIVCWQF